MQTVTIIGLGYVGFPLAELCAKKGYAVYGIDINQKKIEDIRNGINPVDGSVMKHNFNVSSDNPECIRESDVIIICVPTPVDRLKNPDLKPIIDASEYVAKNLGKNKPLVVVESTINPGVMEDVVKHIFDKRGHKIESDYCLAHCPERINPGDAKWTVENIPRVIGAFGSKCLETAQKFYSSIIDAKITKMSSVRAAEATKIVENAFRDINIAFVNELARSFDKLGIDTVEVIDGAATKPFSFMPHYPGCGVGGHCIPVDPYYLIEKAKEVGFEHKFLKLAREINNSMPKYTVKLMLEALNKNKLAMYGQTIGILGLSYKANVGDLRESPALEIKELVEKYGGIPVVYDPFIKHGCSSLNEFQDKCDKIILCTAHDEFKNLDFSRIKILIDGRNMFRGQRFKFYYKGIGR